jgi:hypothetical protein
MSIPGIGMALPSKRFAFSVSRPLVPFRALGFDPILRVKRMTVATPRITPKKRITRPMTVSKNAIELSQKKNRRRPNMTRN